jgi:putative hydrolase of the HAD superfamily
MKRAITFDFSGVLTSRNKRQRMIQSWEAQLHMGPGELRGHLYKGEPWTLLITGRSTADEYISLVLAELGLPSDHELRVLKEPFLLDTIDRRMVGVLSHLSRFTKIALLSNAPRSLRLQIESEGISHLFDPMLISAELGVRKPDCRIYQILLDRVHVQPAECVFVDDKEEYLAPATALGMGTVHFSDPNRLLHQLRGFGFPGNEEWLEET